MREESFFRKIMGDFSQPAPVPPADPHYSGEPERLMRMTPLIQTGLQSLDFEMAAGGGHLIVVIGETDCGKTALLNTIREKNEKGWYSMPVGRTPTPEYFCQQMDLCNAHTQSKIKLLELEYFPRQDFELLEKKFSEFRESLIKNNQWAVVTVNAQREGLGLKRNMIERAPLALVRMADYVFGMTRNKDKASIVNIKNRYRCGSRKTTNITVRFKHKFDTWHNLMLLEEIDPLAAK